MNYDEALAKCEEYGREVMGMASTQGKMLEILTSMSNTHNSRIGLPDEYVVPLAKALEGFRKLLAPKYEEVTVVPAR